MDLTNLPLDDDQDTALHIAVAKQNMTIIVYLLDYGVTVNAVNKAGDTALHLAVRLGCSKVSALLERYGADPALKNKDQMSPVDIAYEKMDHDLIELLSPDAQLSIGMTQR